MSDLKVGETYSLNEIGASLGGSMLTPSDHIITEDLSWERLTVGRLMEWLQMSVDAGEIDEDTLVFADSDPEGNGFHPLRASVLLGEVTFNSAGQPEDVRESSGTPVASVLFGVGY